MALCKTGLEQVETEWVTKLRDAAGPQSSIPEAGGPETLAGRRERRDMWVVDSLNSLLNKNSLVCSHKLSVKKNVNNMRKRIIHTIWSDHWKVTIVDIWSVPSQIFFYAYDRILRYAFVKMGSARPRIFVSQYGASIFLGTLDIQR